LLRSSARPEVVGKRRDSLTLVASGSNSLRASAPYRLSSTIEPTRMLSRDYGSDPRGKFTTASTKPADHRSDVTLMRALFDSR